MCVCVPVRLCVCVNIWPCVSVCDTRVYVRFVMSFGFNVLKNLCMHCAICSALVLYINTAHPEVLPNVFFLWGLCLSLFYISPHFSPPLLFVFSPFASSPLRPLSSPSPRFSSPPTETVPFSRYLTVLKDTSWTACRIRFLPCSQSTQFPRDQGGMEFICLRGAEQVCTFHWGATWITLCRSSEDSALNIIERELVLVLNGASTFSMPPPLHTDVCTVIHRVTRSRWHTQSISSPAVHRKAF